MDAFTYIEQNGKTFWSTFPERDDRVIQDERDPYDGIQPPMDLSGTNELVAAGEDKQERARIRNETPKQGGQNA